MEENVVDAESDHWVSELPVLTAKGSEIQRTDKGISHTWEAFCFVHSPGTEADEKRKSNFKDVS